LKQLILVALITLLAIGTACGQASEPEPVASDGIQVHGDWTVTVTNPDGTLDAVHEFENALSDNGALTRLILGQNNIDLMVIRLHTTSPTEIGMSFNCEENIAKSFGKRTLETVITVHEEEYLPFTVSSVCSVTDVTGGKTGKLVSVGTYFYDHDACVHLYEDNIPFSNSCVPPKGSAQLVTANYNGPVQPKGYAVLTHHELEPQIPVTEGQILGINVKISFS